MKPNLISDLAETLAELGKLSREIDHPLPPRNVDLVVTYVIRTPSGELRARLTEAEAATFAQLTGAVVAAVPATKPAGRKGRNGRP